MDKPRAESPLVSRDAETPRDDVDETLGRAIDAGRLDPDLAANDERLAGAFAAHQKLESLFALLRGELPLSPGEGWGEGRENDPPSTQLGRYQVQSTLGAGAFGTVYLARDPELNRDVAIKLCSLSFRERAGVRADVERAGVRADVERARVRADAIAAEARHAAGLNHPQIVTIYDVGRESNRLFIVMEYVPGQTLAELLREGSGPRSRFRGCKREYLR